MTRVDFYLLSGQNDRDRWMYACRLTEKAYKLGHRIFVRTDSDEESKTIDDLLWTFRDRAFVPHQRYSAEWNEKLTVHIGTEIPNTPFDVLVNLSSRIPEDLKQCERIAEIVDEREAIKIAARDRYKSYKDQGCELNTHQVSG